MDHWTFRPDTVATSVGCQAEAQAVSLSRTRTPAQRKSGQTQATQRLEHPRRAAAELARKTNIYGKDYNVIRGAKKCCVLGRN